MDLSIDCDEFAAKASSRGIITVQLEDIDKRDLNNEEVAKCIDFEVYAEAKGVDELIAWIRQNYELDQED